MTKTKNNGVLTNPMDVKTKEFKQLQHLILQKASALSEEQKRELELFAIQVKMEDYLDSNDTGEEILTVGDFLRLYIDKLGLKQNKLAKYIGLNPANLNKILSGNRKLNFELSFMLSQLFNLDPKVWILIQVKNEYIQLKKEKASYFEKFKLEDLIGV